MRRCAVAGGRRQQRRETGEERHVDGDQGGRGEIPLEAGRAVTQPPDHGAQHGDQQPQAERVRAGVPGQTHCQHATGDQWHQRRVRAAASDRAGHLPDADGDRGGDHRQEGRRIEDQRHHDQRAEAEPDPDRRGKVAPGPPGAHLLGGRSVEAGPPSTLRPSTGRRSRRPAPALRPDGRELLGRVPGVVEAAGRAVETARLVDAPTVRAVVPGRPPRPREVDPGSGRRDPGRRTGRAGCGRRRAVRSSTRSRSSKRSSGRTGRPRSSYGSAACGSAYGRACGSAYSSGPAAGRRLHWPASSSWSGQGSATGRSGRSQPRGSLP